MTGSMIDAGMPYRNFFAGKHPLKIGLLGTRGIPNQYGGFEQFAECFSVSLVQKGQEVFVYTPHNHPYENKTYKGVRLIRCYDPEYKLGTVGQFIYDLNCILDSRKRNFDIILQLGYTSSSIWSFLFPQKSLLVTNMDGQEWKRAKYNQLTRNFLRYAEQLAVKKSDYLIADSTAIQIYLKDRYDANAVYVPYGAELYEPFKDDFKTLSTFQLSPFAYDLLIARFQPENNIEMVLKAYANHPETTLLLIGDNQANLFGKHCSHKYNAYPNIRFMGAVFHQHTLNMLRYYSRLYFHGHSVGGTNPSLLEAMACRALVAAHDNVFNQSVLGDDAFYFKTDSDIAALLRQQPDKQQYAHHLDKNQEKIRQHYDWEKITQTLLTYFQQWKPLAT